jgi:hypothetical protein
MPRRRILDSRTTAAALAQAAEARRACIAICAQAPIGGPEYRAASRLTSEIDAFAEALTGDRQRFWNKSHGQGA